MGYDSQHLEEATRNFSRAGTAFSEFVEALCAGAVEVFSYLAECINNLPALSFQACLPVWEVKAAIDSASPKLRHYAIYAKRYRIRKKYLGRILKEYQEKKEG